MPNLTPTTLEVAAATSENQAIIDVAQIAAGPKVIELEAGKLYGAQDEADELVVVDLERYLPAPNRKRGVVLVHRAASLAQYVNVHKIDGTELYADEQAATVVAVFNDHAHGSPGWGDHRAALHVRSTPEWKRWKALDGKIGDQETFAEHVEISLLDIVDPPGADMLELAQSFHATKAAIFKSDRRLATGQVQVQYEETLAASAGVQKNMAIPATFTLNLRPFEGSDQYDVTARLRYRLVEGHLRIGYALDRPDEIVRQAFDDVLSDIENLTDIVPLHGQPRS